MRPLLTKQVPGGGRGSGPGAGDGAAVVEAHLEVQGLALLHVVLDLGELGAGLLELVQILGGHFLRLVGLPLVGPEANGEPINDRALLLLVRLVQLQLAHGFLVFARVLQVLLGQLVVLGFFALERLLQLRQLLN